MSLIELQSVGSTNDYAKDLAKKGADSGTVIWAREQTAGRGRQGNSWVSNLGNLYMSVILHPKVDAADVGQLSFVAAVSMANVIEKFLPSSAVIQLKWPNDLLLNGKKAAGILIESEGPPAVWVVVGMGVNIISAPEGATSLHASGGEGSDVRGLMEALTNEFAKQVEVWENGGFAAIRAAWMKRAYKVGEEIRARLPQETLTGVFEGIDADGALQLRLPDGALRVVHSGEVFI